MEAINFLEANGIKPTKLRVDIINILLNAKKPVSYDEILSFVDANKTTIYRTFDILEDKKLIYKFEENRKFFYSISKKWQAHFFCESCKKIEEIKMPKLNKKNVKSVTVTGICESCEG